MWCSNLWLLRVRSLKGEFDEIDLTGVKQDLSQLISIFEELEKNNENYCVDEAKLTVGLDSSSRLP